MQSQEPDRTLLALTAILSCATALTVVALIFDALTPPSFLFPSRTLSVGPPANDARVSPRAIPILPGPGHPGVTFPSDRWPEGER